MLQNLDDVLQKEKQTEEDDQMFVEEEKCPTEIIDISNQTIIYYLLQCKVIKKRVKEMYVNQKVKQRIFKLYKLMKEDFNK